MTSDRNDHAQAASPPPPHPELKRLEPLLGRWTADDHTYDTVLGPGVRTTSTESFSWLEGGYSSSAHTRLSSGVNLPSVA
jgi:hypothetical protein